MCAKSVGNEIQNNPTGGEILEVKNKLLTIKLIKCKICVKNRGFCDKFVKNRSNIRVSQLVQKVNLLNFIKLLFKLCLMMVIWKLMWNG